MSIEDKYAFVHNPHGEMQGIGIKDGKYKNVIYEYGKVSFGELEDEPEAATVIASLLLRSCVIRLSKALQSVVLIAEG